MQFLCMFCVVSKLIEATGTRDFIILKKGLTLTPCCICGALAGMLLASRILVRHLSRVTVGWDESAASLSLFRGAMPKSGRSGEQKARSLEPERTYAKNAPHPPMPGQIKVRFTPA